MYEEPKIFMKDLHVNLHSCSLDYICYHTNNQYTNTRAEGLERHTLFPFIGILFICLHKFHSLFSVGPPSFLLVLFKYTSMRLSEPFTKAMYAAADVR
jgi:hypothetical protein